MKQVLVDANVLISFLTDRNESQQEKAAALLRGAAHQEHTLALHSITIVETVHVLVQLYKADPFAVSSAVSKLLAAPGVVTVAAVPWRLVLELWPRVIPSFGDAIVAAVASEGRHDAVATFDLDLRKKLSNQGCVSYWSD
ncbi:MAG TPA: PIN domain-containing protein [Thermoanaerobaculia bacterium]|nr:PIN domain-containing protein [Thermoanaerobaculia bacterium]